MVLKLTFIKREWIKLNPNVVFLFGDNVSRYGAGGQAKEMRGEPNAIGIATKWSPSTNPQDYFSDKEFSQCKKVIDDDFAKIPPFKSIVIPVDSNGKCTLGCGLASLDKRAPAVFKYLQGKIDCLIKERSK